MTNYNQTKFIIDVTRYLLAQKRDATVAENMFASEGLCSGISVLWLYCMHMSHQPKTDKRRDDIEWYYETRQLLADWDGKRKFTLDEINEIDHMLEKILLFQDSLLIGSHQSELNELLLDSKNRQFQREYQLTGAFTQKQLANILGAIIKPHKMNLISLPQHAVALYYDGTNYMFMDPNDASKNVSAKTAEELARELLKSCEYKAQEIVPISFSIFDSHTSKTEYPDHGAILSTIPSAQFTTLAKKPNEMTALHMAAGKSDVDSIAHMLAQPEVDRNVTLGEEKIKPVELTAFTGNIECMKLFQQEFSPRMSEMAALSKAGTETINFLMAHGIDLSQQFTEDRGCLLATISQDLLEKFKKVGGTFEHVDKKGRNAIVVAALRGDAARIKLLIEGGTDFQQALKWFVDKQLCDPFHMIVDIATEMGLAIDWGKLLETAAASDVKLPKQPPLSLLMYRKSVKEIEKTLCKEKLQRRRALISFVVEKSQNINAINESGLTVLHIAAMSSRLSNLAILLSMGADPNIRTPSGESAYSIIHHKKITLDVGKLNQLFEKNNFDFNAELLRCYERKDWLVFKAVLDAGANISDVNGIDLILKMIKEASPGIGILVRHLGRTQLIERVLATDDIQSQVKLVEMEWLQVSQLLLKFADDERLTEVISALGSLLREPMVGKIIRDSLASNREQLAIALINKFSLHATYSDALMKLMDDNKLPLLNGALELMQPELLLAMAKHALDVNNLKNMTTMYQKLDAKERHLLFDYAISRNNMDAIKQMLSAGFNMGLSKALLLNAVLKNDELELFQLLEASLNWEVKDYQQLLQRACEQSSNAIAQYCLSKRVQDYIRLRKGEEEHVPSLFSRNPLPACKHWVRRNTFFNCRGRLMYTEQQKNQAALALDDVLAGKNSKESLSRQEHMALKNGRLGELHQAFEMLARPIKTR